MKLSQKIKLLAMLFVFSVVGLNAENFKPIDFTEETLDNGLHVIYHIDRTAPVVATVVHYRVGCSDEDPEHTGYAHFFEHLMFEATDGYERAMIDQMVEEAGGTLNAGTSFDQTVYYFKMPANELKLALWIESQRMRKLHVQEEGVETQRGVVLEEINVREKNSAYGLFLKKMLQNMFTSGTYHWTALGESEHIANATIEDFQNFYNNYYQPANATLVIAGDFEIDKAKEYVRAYFGQYKEKKIPERIPVDVNPVTKEYRETVPDHKAQLPGVFIGYHGPSYTDEDFYAMSLLSDILAAGESSRLYQRLVDQERLAAAASSFPLVLEKSGAVILYGIANPDEEPEDIEEIIFEEIEKIIEEGVSADELEKAKNIQEVQFVSSKKNVLPKARSLAKYYSVYNDASLINTELDKYLAVTQEDIKRVAKKYFDTEKRVILTFVPAEKENQ